MKIRSKLLLPIYSCILISFIAIGVSTYLIVYQNNLQNGFDHLETRTELKSNEVDNFLDELTEKLTEFSSSSENVEAVKTLSKFQRNKESNEYKQALESLRNNITHLRAIHPEIQEVIFADVFGITVYSLLSDENIGNFIEHDYGKGFLKRSQESLFISDIRLKDRNNPESSFIFASRPIIENKGTIGSLIIEMDSRSLDKILSLSSGLGDTGETYIVGRDGLIKTHRKNFNFMKFSTQINPYAFKGCFDESSGTMQSKQYINIIGEKVMGTYKYISEIDMCLITEIYLDEVLSTAKNILFIILIGSILMFLGISILISTFVRNITSPLEYLTKKIVEVGKGNKNIELNIESNDEIGDLTKSFQEMLRKLSITDERIIRKVNEQTKEIKKKQEETENLNKDLLKFQEALKEASDYIAILDRKYKIVYINTSLEKETGYTLKQCIGKHTYDFWRRGEEKSSIKKIWAEVTKKKDSMTVEMITTRKDGSDFISDVHISPILNKNGKIMFYLTIETDITQETKVKKMKDDFISLVSHELRTPMTVIRGFTKIILDESFGSLNKDQKKYLGRINSNVDYLISMVNDMLDIEKLNSGKINFKYKTFNIHELLLNVKNELEIMCEGKSIKMNVTGKKQLVNSDPEKLKQVIINLVRNSYKFTPENGTISMILSKKRQLLKVEVVDTGIGIKKEDFEKIFQKFGQVATPLQKQYEGTGLGLSICQLIIEKLGGEIGFESVYSQGSTFYFTLPTTRQ